MPTNAELEAEIERLRRLMEEMSTNPPGREVFYRCVWESSGRREADGNFRRLVTAMEHVNGRAENGCKAWVERGVIEWELIEDTVREPTRRKGT